MKRDHMFNRRTLLHGLGATLALPSNDPELRTFAREAVQNTEAPLDALVAAVHYQLNYREGTPATDVLQAFDRGYGECTDFADLFTTLALSLGWPARTVYGLAYDATDPPGLAMHAWNEVRVDGRWHSVDPTWNQNPIDATHMRLDDETLARLKYLQGSRGLKASVHSRQPHKESDLLPGRRRSQRHRVVEV